MITESTRMKLSVADGTEMGAYVSRPRDAGRHPGIIVFQEALGVNPQIRGVADRYAALGFVAVAPDLFHRVRRGYEANAIVMEELMPLVNCMGGRAVYIANSELPLAAAISYYAGAVAPSLLDRAGSMHGPHLFFWGGRDKGIPPEQHRAVADAYRAAGKDFVDVEFSDCDHAFFNEQADRYSHAAAKQSWAMGLAFLADALALEE